MKTKAMQSKKRKSEKMEREEREERFENITYKKKKIEFKFIGIACH